MSVTTEHVREVTHNQAAGRFEVHQGNSVAALEYRRRGENMVILHTEVPEELEGIGIASKLAHTALDYARNNGLGVIPLCPFVATYIRRHREYRALVPAEYANLVDQG